MKPGLPAFFIDGSILIDPGRGTGSALTDSVQNKSAPKDVIDKRLKKKKFIRICFFK